MVFWVLCVDGAADAVGLSTVSTALRRKAWSVALGLAAASERGRVVVATEDWDLRYPLLGTLG